MVYQAVHSSRIARIIRLRYQNFEFVDAGTEDADLLGAFWLFLAALLGNWRNNAGV